MDPAIDACARLISIIKINSTLSLLSVLTFKRITHSSSKFVALFLLLLLRYPPLVTSQQDAKL